MGWARRLAFGRGEDKSVEGTSEAFYMAVGHNGLLFFVFSSMAYEGKDGSGVLQRDRTRSFQPASRLSHSAGITLK